MSTCSVERRTVNGNGTQLDYGFAGIGVGHVNATTHSAMATGTAFDEITHVWDAASNKTHRFEWDGATAVKEYEYQYDALSRLQRSIKRVVTPTAGTAGNWTGDMTLDSTTPDIATFMGGTPPRNRVARGRRIGFQPVTTCAGMFGLSGVEVRQPVSPKARPRASSPL